MPFQFSFSEVIPSLNLTKKEVGRNLMEEIPTDRNQSSCFYGNNINNKSRREDSSLL